MKEKKVNIIVIIVAILLIIGIIVFIIFTQKNKGTDMSEEKKLINEDISKIEEDTNSINIKKVVTGDSHTIVEDINGEIWVCGDNSSGELGIGNTESQEYLVKIGKTNTGKNIVFPNKIVAGSGITIIEDKDGEIWVCGSNAYGELGLGNTERKITTLTRISKTVTGKEMTYPNTIKCGNGFILVEDKDGMIWTCGDNHYGELGVGDKENRNVLTQIVNTQTGKNIIKPNKIEVGSSFWIIEDSDGIVWGCGENRYNQLFVEGKRDNSRLFEIEIVGDHPNKIAAGSQHVIIEKKDGTLIGAGRNLYGELTGYQKEAIKYSFKYKNGKEVVNPKEIICNDYVTIIRDDEEQIWVCGYNYGQFGNLNENADEDEFSQNTNLKIYELTLLNDLSNRKFEKISNITVGNGYLIIEDDKNNFWCAGENSDGQLGVGTMEEEESIGSFIKFAKNRKELYINHNTDTEMKYEIVEEIPGINISEKQRGYKVIEKNGFFYITILMGEQTTGGHSIKIAKVDISGNDIHIYVKEEFSGGVVTTAFEYPVEIVKLNVEPNNIIVENQNTGSRFKKLN